jgi:FKBP-type peptidyl-prolyl cis-trans isomerase
LLWLKGVTVPDDGVRKVVVRKSSFTSNKKEGGDGDSDAPRVVSTGDEVTIDYVLFLLDEFGVQGTKVESGRKFTFQAGAGTVIKGFGEDHRHSPRPFRPPLLATPRYLSTPLTPRTPLYHVCLDAGTAGMCVGERRVVEVPWPLAYGKRGSAPDIPSEADLLFHITVVAINGAH